MTRTLWPHQTRALDDAKAAYRAGKRAICIVLPTGGGKTTIGSTFAMGAARKGAKQVWWLAHRDELVEQAKARLLADGAERVGVIAAGYPASNAPLQVASIQTLAARAAKGLPTDLDLVVYDECHHLPAPSWLDVVRKLKPKLLIGLTATPERGDGRGLGVHEQGLFDHLIQVATVRELQALDILVPCVTYAPATKRSKLSQDPVAAYLARAPGERAFVFVKNVAQAEKLAISFVSQGVPAATIHADTPLVLRQARLEAFKTQDRAALLQAGTTEQAPIVLVNVYTLTEGVDVPEASCCILARGCGHPGMMLQMVGRVLRAAPGSTKTRAVFVDLCGVVHKLGLPEADREWSLDGKAGSLKESERILEPKPCPACEAMVTGWSTDREGWRICPVCKERVAAPEAPQVAPRQLHTMGSGAPEKERTSALYSFAMLAARKGFKMGWIFHRYRDRFCAEPARADVRKAWQAAIVAHGQDAIDAARADRERSRAERGAVPEPAESGPRTAEAGDAAEPEYVAPELDGDSFGAWVAKVTA